MKHLPRLVWIAFSVGCPNHIHQGPVGLTGGALITTGLIRHWLCGHTRQRGLSVSLSHTYSHTHNSYTQTLSACACTSLSTPLDSLAWSLQLCNRVSAHQLHHMTPRNVALYMACFIWLLPTLGNLQRHWGIFHGMHTWKQYFPCLCDVDLYNVWCVICG